MEDQPVVRATGIRKRFPGVVALDDVTIKLRSGEIHALAGENGSGKSTLAKILCGALRPDSGVLTLDGEEVAFSSPRSALERGIVAISQELTLAPTLSVTENVLMGRLPLGRFGRIDWPEAHRIAGDALGQLNVEVEPSRRVADLSVELRQEIEIARAVTAEPRLLILDEATSSLSEAATEQLLLKLGQLRDRGVAVLFISHRLKEIYACATTVTVLRDGCLVGAFDVAETDEEQLVASMVGRPLESLYGRHSTGFGGPALSVVGLNTVDGTVRDVNLEVRSGEVVGVAGLVGSGKAELGLALAGALKSAGEIRVGGHSVELSSPRRSIAAGIGFVPDDRKRAGLLPTRSVRHNLSLAWLQRLRRWYGIDTRAEHRLANAATSRFAIRTRSLDSPITQLSGGNQQKVMLARWLSLDCKALVLSEPTRGIDVGAKEEVYRFIQEAAERGTGILMISSELPELLGVSDRLLVMFRGEIRGEFSRADATEEAVAHVALTGLASEVAA
jgi:ABC-type sugar transport system ATPase subunit